MSFNKVIYDRANILTRLTYFDHLILPAGGTR